MSDYHENAAGLDAAGRDIARALISLKEEIDAINWYHQRIAAADDPELKDMLAHNRDEEMEHACMAMEWLRRRMPSMDEAMRTYFFTDRPIMAVEESHEENESMRGDTPRKPGTGEGGMRIGGLKDGKR